MGVVSELENGEVDLVIGCFGELPGGVRRATLYQEEEAIVAICKPHFTVVPPQACQSALVSEGPAFACVVCRDAKAGAFAYEDL
jgi:hypothetical protein